VYLHIINKYIFKKKKKTKVGHGKKKKRTLSWALVTACAASWDLGQCVSTSFFLYTALLEQLQAPCALGDADISLS
jgi:hypothetical protein